jgi:hypothetical protein
LITSFLICIPFISSPCLIALVRNSKTMLNNSGESRHLCHAPDFRGNGFSLSPFSMMLTIGSSCITFIVLRCIPSISSFFRAYTMKGCRILLKAFSAFIEMVMWFLSLLLLICYIIFNDLHMLNHPCITGMKPS